VCGNGKVEAGETCDVSGLSADCDFDCTVPECGDRIVNPDAGEECEPGAESPRCTSACTFAACGNGNVDADEECDDAGDSPTCDGDCSGVECGDGWVNAAADEQCEPGPENPGCAADCTITNCGNGDVEAGEACDDVGESVDCDVDCTLPECGDDLLNVTAGEACEDGNSNNSDGCVACEIAACGDGFVYAGFEQCDDDNPSCGSCNATCDDVVASAAATGSIVAPDGASFIDTAANSDRLTISDGAGSTVTFEFHIVDGGEPGSHGLTPIDIFTTSTAGEVMDATAAAINMGVLRIDAVHGSGDPEITLTHQLFTVFGNQTITDTVDSAGFTVEGMSGGEGGDCNTGAECTTGADCRSNVCGGVPPNATCAP
jgi:hypothetical protein